MDLNFCAEDFEDLNHEAKPSNFYDEKRCGAMSGEAELRNKDLVIAVSRRYSSCRTMIQ